MKSFRLSVPGNLLLAGEYAVTEEGGLGLTMSPGPRITLSARPAEQGLLEGVWPGGGETFHPGFPTSGLLSAVWSVVFSQGSPLETLPCWHIKVDSCAFFDSQGRKKGFGSSAATAAVLTAALVLIRDGAQPSKDLQEVARRAFLPAVNAHRAFQGGKGSGYDVAASLFGGLGLFRGGVKPDWTPASFALPSPLALAPGPEAVRTISALGNYREWKRTFPRDYERFLEENNRQVSQLAGKKEFDSHLLRNIRDAARKLGRDIGISADWDPPADRPNLGWKALGAGNEIILLWDENGRGELLPGEPVNLEKEGLKWEPLED